MTGSSGDGWGTVGTFSLLTFVLAIASSFINWAGTIQYYGQLNG
jgi:hypothetical protein